MYKFSISVYLAVLMPQGLIQVTFKAVADAGILKRGHRQWNDFAKCYCQIVSEVYIVDL